MSAQITHHHGYASLLAAGTLNWKRCRELEDAVHAAVREYGYDLVELVVASPGGTVAAVRSLLSTLERFRDDGVRFRTRVRSIASSAGALIVVLGDERVAEPHARLEFHFTELYRPGRLSASRAASIERSLARADERMVELIVERVFEGPVREVEHGAEASDRAVLVALCDPASELDDLQTWTIAEGVGQCIVRIVEDGDREALAKIYRRLLEVDSSISARLARTLRLVDRISPLDEGAPVSSEPPSLVVPEWEALHPPAGEVPREALCRHVLVLGESGSGKTDSCLKPLVAAMATAPSDRVGGALILDPDADLAPVVRSLAGDRLHVVDTERAVVNLMAGRSRSLEDHLARGAWLTAAALVVHRSVAFVPSSPARVLDELSYGAPADFDAHLHHEATALVLDLVALVLFVLSPSTPARERWLAHDAEASGWVAELEHRAHGTPDARGPSIVAIAAWALESAVAPAGDSRCQTAYAERTLLSRMGEAILVLGSGIPGDETRELGRDLVRHRGTIGGSGLDARILAAAHRICTPFATPPVSHALYFGCEPGYAPAPERTPDLAAAAATHGDGPFIVFTPAVDGSDRLVGDALAMLLVEEAQGRLVRTAESSSVPLVGLVVDRIDRALERAGLAAVASLLDSGRGAFAVLAARSVADVERALGGGAEGEARFASLWSAAATKILLRSTDPVLGKCLVDLSPDRPKLPAPARVRPLSTLTPGECFAVHADGRIERRRMTPFDPGRFREEDPSETLSVLIEKVTGARALAGEQS